LVKLDEETAGSDLVCGIWLSVSPNLGNQTMPVRAWAQEIGKTHKLPMAFIFAKDDTAGDTNALSYVKAINADYVRGKPAKDKDLQLTGDKAIPGTKLAGSKLLDKNLGTEDFIVKEYLEPVLDKHRFSQWKKRDTEEAYYYWRLSTGPLLAKRK